MKQIPVEVYKGGAVICVIPAGTCKFAHQCTNHGSAGDFRSESGWQPILTGLTIDNPPGTQWMVGEGTVYCTSFVEGKRERYDDIEQLYEYEKRLQGQWNGEVCAPIVCKDDISPQLPLIFDSV